MSWTNYGLRWKTAMVAAKTAKTLLLKNSSEHDKKHEKEKRKGKMEYKRTREEIRKLLEGRAIKNLLDFHWHSFLVANGNNFEEAKKHLVFEIMKNDNQMLSLLFWKSLMWKVEIVDEMPDVP